MKNQIFAILLGATCALPATAGTFTDRFTSFYAFGDSLSDDGKFGALFPPSEGGRFSNGPTYAEIIAQEFTDAGRDTGNLALGGATAGNVNAIPLGPLGTFLGQVGVFQNALVNALPLPTRADFSQFTDAPPAPGSNPLVSVLFGANDFFQGQDVIAAANAVADGIRALGANIGGEFDDFLVATQPDIGRTPAFQDDAALFATAQSDAFNAQLLANIDDLIGEGYNIYTLDIQSAIQVLLDDIEAGGDIYGVLDAVTPCTARLSEPGPACDNPNELLYTDLVHPNAVAHQVIADRAIIQLAAIPLPATAPLMILGLAGMGWAGRRARA